jgi:hypothetical protein
MKFRRNQAAGSGGGLYDRPDASVGISASLRQDRMTKYRRFAIGTN